MEIKAPDLGVESAEVSEIVVSVGDRIEKDDTIMLLESDKASVEVPSSASGKVTSIAVSVGDQVSEGSLLIELEVKDVQADADEQADPAGTDTTDPSTDNRHASEASDGTDVSDRPRSTEQANAAKNESSASKSLDDSADAADSQSMTQTYQLPDLGVDEAQVAEVMVAVGDEVQQDQSVLLIESDKASVEVPAPVSGKIKELLVSSGDTVANGQDFIVIESMRAAEVSSDDTISEKPIDGQKRTTQTDDSAQSMDKGESKKSAAAKQTAPDQGSRETHSGQKLTETQVNEKLTDVYAGPAVRKLARQLGIDITKVTGSAANQRVVKEDLFSFVKTKLTSTGADKPAKQSAASGLPSLPDMSNAQIWGETETLELSRLQKVSIPQLNYNTYLPQVTQFDLWQKRVK